MNFWSIAFVAITFAVLFICAMYDRKNKEKVPFWLFFIIPVVYFAVTIYYKNPINWVYMIIGIALSIPFFVMAFMGKCGGADAIMVACIGTAYGGLYTAVWLFTACLIFILTQLIKNRKTGAGFKQIMLDKTQSAFIPSATIAFAIISIVFIIIPYIF